jgi:hypothetical protein
MKSAFSTIFGWCAFGLILWGIYYAADTAGYVPHSIETSITAQPNWLVGETKECFSPILDAKTAAQLGKETGDPASLIYCDDGPEHIIKVTVFGNLEQLGHKTATWRCTREADSFTCRQIGAK